MQNNAEEAQKRSEEKAERRKKKGRPSMKVSGRGMKRFAKPERKKPESGSS